MKVMAIVLPLFLIVESALAGITLNCKAGSGSIAISPTGNHSIGMLSVPGLTLSRMICSRLGYDGNLISCDEGDYSVDLIKHQRTGMFIAYVNKEFKSLSTKANIYTFRCTPK